MKPVAFLPGARLDFDQSFDWYASRSGVAAESFSHAVDETVGHIANGPEQFAKVDSLHRACLLKRFRSELSIESRPREF